MCQIDLVHLMSYIVYWYEPSDLAYEISHLIWHMRFTAIWGNRSTVDPIVLPIIDILYLFYLFFSTDNKIAMLYYPSALMMHVRGSHPPGVLPITTDS